MSNPFNDRFTNLNKLKFHYAFVFYSNLNKTNLQYKELFNNILRQHGEFYSINEYRNFDFTTNVQKSNNKGNIVIIPCKNSCIVSSNIELNIKEIIRNSGYVQSCGELLFLSPWYDLNTTTFENRVEQFISRDRDKKGRLVFYTKEDFGLKTRSSEGIDDIKFFKEKYYIGNEIASNYMKGLLQNELISNNLIVERLYNSDKEKYNKTITDFSLFVVKDLDLTISETEYVYGEKEPQLFILYHSQFKKENPIHILDENKPFIPGPYTTPQTLIQSMLSFVSNETKLIIDPFGGSGGIGIASKFGGKDIFISDLIGLEGIDYNFRFFNTKSKLREQIENFINEQLIGFSRTKEFSPYFYESAEKIIATNKYQEKHWISEYDELLIESPDIIESDIFKYCFFVSYKLIILHNDLIKQNNRLNEYLFTSMLEKHLTDEKIILQRTFKALLHPEFKKKPWEELKGKYGNYITGYTKLEGEKHLCQDSIHLLNNNSRLNLQLMESEMVSIVSDPPYGFNTLSGNPEDENIVNLYESFMDFSLSAIEKTKSKKGDLIICTLRNVKVGKKISSYSYAHNIEKLLYRKLKEYDFNIIAKPYLLEIGDWIGNGNYWKSKKALDRRIISITVEKNKAAANKA